MAQPRIVLTNYGVKHWMILNTDKLWLVKVIFFICKFDFSISSISSTNTGKQMERGNIIEDLTFKLCQLRKT